MTNINQNPDVNLADENEESKYLNMVLVPKPFTFEGLISPDLTKVYLPGQVDKNEKYACSCVHFCKEFETYPIIQWGIRYIPAGATCPYGGGVCHGSRIFVNGKPTNQAMTCMQYEMIKGLSKFQKTR